VALIQCFLVENKQVLNLKDLGPLLSQKNGRLRTTLCKLYQICHILEAVGVVDRSIIAGEIKLNDRYFVKRDIAERQLGPSMPSVFSVKALLA
jgi:hypothetical protein